MYIGKITRLDPGEDALFVCIYVFIHTHACTLTHIYSYLHTTGLSTYMFMKESLPYQNARTTLMEIECLGPGLVKDA